MKNNILLEQCYNFIKVPKRKQQYILDILNSCKEIRDTMYPNSALPNTKLKIKSFSAIKEKDVYSISGIMSLDNLEERSFEAYIVECQSDTKIYMDIERINVEEEPKMIRTSETIVENENSFMVATKYCDSESIIGKTFFYEIPKYEENNSLQLEMTSLNI